MGKKQLGDWQGALVLNRVKALFPNAEMDLELYQDDKRKIGYRNFWTLKSPFGHGIELSVSVFFEYFASLRTIRCTLKHVPLGGLLGGRETRLFEVSAKESGNVDDLVKKAPEMILESLEEEVGNYVQQRKGETFLRYVCNWLGGENNVSRVENERLETYIAQTPIAPKYAKLYVCRFVDTGAWCFFVKIGEEKNKLLLTRQEYDGFKETKDMKAFFDKKVFPWTDKLL